MNKKNILQQVKNTVHKTDTKAKLIYARGDDNKHAALDLLVLFDQEKLQDMYF